MHKKEFNDVKKMISHIEHNSQLLDSVTKSLFAANSNLTTYIIKNYTVIVGLMIVRYVFLFQFLMKEFNELNIFWNYVQIYKICEKTYKLCNSL